MDFQFIGSIGLDATYWYMFPIAIVIATIGNMAGIGGGPFFSPIMILLLQLQPATAIATTVFTKAFGTSSGSFAYFKRELIDFEVALKLLVFILPASLLGLYLIGIVPKNILQIILGIGIVLIAYNIFKSPREHELKGRSGHEIIWFSRKRKTQLSKSYANQLRLLFGGPLCALGALSDTLIGSGLGEINDYFLIVKSRIPTKIAVGTSIFIIAVTAIISSIGRLFGSATPVLGILIFTIPGVIIGAQIGAALSSHFKPDMLKRVLSVTLLVVGFILAGTGLMIQ